MNAAIQDYTKAIELDAGYVDAYNNRAVSFFHMKEYQKAWQDVKKCQELGGQVATSFLEELKKLLKF